MKKQVVFALLIFFLGSFRFLSPVTVTPYDKADFSTQFQLVFEAAKKRFVNEFGAQDKSFTSDVYAKKFGATIPFKNGTVSLLEDAEQLKTYQVLFPFEAASLDEAKSIKKEAATLVKSLLPADYKTYSTYVAGYAGYMTEMFEFNSDIFAEVSKRPVVRIGIILLSEGKYNLEIIVSEPVFKK